MAPPFNDVNIVLLLNGPECFKAEVYRLVFSESPEFFRFFFFIQQARIPSRSGKEKFSQLIFHVECETFDAQYEFFSLEM